MAVPWAAVCLDDHLVAGWPQQTVCGRGRMKRKFATEEIQCVDKNHAFPNQAQLRLPLMWDSCIGSRCSLGQKGAAIALEEGADQSIVSSSWFITSDTARD